MQEGKQEVTKAVSLVKMVKKIPGVNSYISDKIQTELNRCETLINLFCKDMIAFSFTAQSTLLRSC